MISLKTDRYVADDLEKDAGSPGPAIRLNGWPLLLPALIVLLWHIAAVERWMPEQILPAPAVVTDTALSLLSGDGWHQWGLASSTWPSGCCWGWRQAYPPGGVVWSRTGRGSAGRTAILCPAQIPTLGWIPLFMVLFGIDNGLEAGGYRQNHSRPADYPHATGGDQRLASAGEAAQVMNFSRWQGCVGW